MDKEKLQKSAPEISRNGGRRIKNPLGRKNMALKGGSVIPRRDAKTWGFFEMGESSSPAGRFSAGRRMGKVLQKGQTADFHAQTPRKT